MPRSVSNALEVAWGVVYARHAQLADIDKRLLDVEPRLWPSFAGPDGLVVGPDLADQLDRMYEVGPEFAFLGEAAFMFCETALNALAETVRTTAGIARKPTSWSFRKLPEEISQANLTVLEPLVPTIRAVCVAVLFPRDVMSVHAPAGIKPSGSSYVHGQRVRLTASRSFPDEDSEQAAPGLRKVLAQDAKLPDLDGDFLVWWVMDNIPERLSKRSRDAVKDYMGRFGCVGSPGEAIVRTRDVIERVGSALGYGPDEWAHT